MKAHALQAPFTAEAVAGLRAGQRVLLSGPLHTARCRVTKFLLDGMVSPAKIEHGAIYHGSPIIVREGPHWVVRAAGASASVLVDAYVPDLIEKYRVRVLVGTGCLGDATRRACARFGCVYLQTVGAASKLTGNIRSVAGVHFLKEFGAADAMWILDVENLEAVVGIDTGGRSVHRRIKAASRRALDELLSSL
ncbi:MAG: fumarate hydratase C-terminal domain-containing protein [Lentisphaerae bacterium]|nr:fumarate hydratase C-terminal domain-containing protein [Lentisphaerota bacterium]